MSHWTPRHSICLSLLLDNIVGTKEMVEIRQDYCMLFGSIYSKPAKRHLTGSKSEGLDLPGSDVDEMREMNVDHNIEIVPEGKSLPQTPRKHLFEMVTENVHPAFAMLCFISTWASGCIFGCLQDIDGSCFLSSYLTVFNHLNKCQHKGVRIQGPSLEHPKTPYTAMEEDRVYCIHCPFWPNAASEWIFRTRSSNWPSNDVINKIVDFGFHLVPIGYPRSQRNMMEWRISFSIAERHLVWSFNHIQIQMYAVMKLILKEFIKPNCSAGNYVLCSYFIKTFLFWKFEEKRKLLLEK